MPFQGIVALHSHPYPHHKTCKISHLPLHARISRICGQMHIIFKFAKYGRPQTCEFNKRNAF